MIALFGRHKRGRHVPIDTWLNYEGLPSASVDSSLAPTAQLPGIQPCPSNEAWRGCWRAQSDLLTGE